MIFLSNMVDQCVVLFLFVYLLLFFCHGRLVQTHVFDCPRNRNKNLRVSMESDKFMKRRIASSWFQKHPQPRQTRNAASSLTCCLCYGPKFPNKVHVVPVRPAIFITFTFADIKAYGLNIKALGILTYNKGYTKQSNCRCNS